MKTYRGHHIERIPHSGMYCCFIAGHGHLKADSLEGIKELIRGAK